MYVIKTGTHGSVRNDSEMHSTGITVSCISLSFRTHPCVLAIKQHNVQSTGHETRK